MLQIEVETRLGELDLDVALEVPSGSCVALAGPSGAGKTSVLRTVAGLLRPEHGFVSCGDEVWLDTSRNVYLAPEQRRCAYVFQDYALFPHLRAWQNVAYSMRGLPRRERRRRASELLDRFGMLQRADALPRTMSGGERQRVAVARALALDPAAILLDEPLAALDARTSAAAAAELHSVLEDAEVPTLMVTHSFDQGALLGDVIGVIDEGRLIQTGTAAELVATPASSFVADFTGAVLLTGSAHKGADGLTHVDLDGGGGVVSTQPVEGAVAVVLYPTEIVLSPAGDTPSGSAQNHLAAEVSSVLSLGNRVRVGLATPQLLVAEVTPAAVDQLSLKPGDRVVATWKAANTRLVSR